MTDADIEGKTRRLIGESGSGCDPDGVIALVWAIDDLPDLRPLLRATSGPSS